MTPYGQALRNPAKMARVCRRAATRAAGVLRRRAPFARAVKPTSPARSTATDARRRTPRLRSRRVSDPEFPWTGRTEVTCWEALSELIPAGLPANFTWSLVRSNIPPARAYEGRTNLDTLAWRTGPADGLCFREHSGRPCPIFNRVTGRRPEVKREPRGRGKALKYPRSQLKIRRPNLINRRLDLSLPSPKIEAKLSRP